MTLIPMKGDSVSDDTGQAELKFESVDKIILEGITNIESDFYDSKLLLEIYRNI
jgi:gamma-glutamyl-gamma-aminobutyrate hydrolase PuuD